MAAIFFAALIVFVAGVSAGIIVVVSAGIRREERDLLSRREEPGFTLTSQAPDRMTNGTRILTGLRVLNADAGVASSREKMLV
jgi:hypothetical protein